MKKDELIEDKPYVRSSSGATAEEIVEKRQQISNMLNKNKQVAEPLLPAQDMTIFIRMQLTLGTWRLLVSRKNGKRNTGRRVAIIEEDGIFSILGRWFSGLFFLEENRMSVSHADSPRTAKKEYDKMVKNSKKRGAKIHHNGKPNKG